MPWVAFKQPRAEADQARGPGIEKIMNVYSLWLVISTNWPRRSPTSSITGPVRSVGISTTSDSNGSCSLAVDLAENHLRLADRHLVALAAHGFDQHREVQHAAAGNGELLGAGDRLDPQGDVPLQLAHQPLAEVAAGEVLSVAAGQRRSVDAEGHFQRRLVDLQPRQRAGIGGRGHRVADFDAFEPDDGADVAGVDLVDLRRGRGPRRRRRETALAGVMRPSACISTTLWPLRMRARLHPADGDSPDVIGPVQRGDEHLQAARPTPRPARESFPGSCPSAAGS